MALHCSRVGTETAQLTTLAVRDDFDDDLWRFAKLPEEIGPMTLLEHVVRDGHVKTDEDVRH
jgi:hypothetical protein